MGLKDNDVIEALKSSTFEINDRHSFLYYYFPGVPIKIETRRTTDIQIGPEVNNNVDITRIKLME